PTEGESVARIDVVMPQMGESIAEGTLSKWLKKVGDSVKRDEPIFEISTDKVDAEIPSPSAGGRAWVPGEGRGSGAGRGRGGGPGGAGGGPPRGVGGPRARGRAGRAAPRGGRRPGGAPPRKNFAPAEPPSLPRTAAAATSSAQGNGANSLEERLRTKSSPL